VIFGDHDAVFERPGAFLVGVGEVGSEKVLPAGGIRVTGGLRGGDACGAEQERDEGGSEHEGSRWVRCGLAEKVTGRNRGLWQFLDADVAPADFFACSFRVFANAMDLKGDEALGREAVFEVGGGDSVEEGLDGIAIALDAGLVPVFGLEGLAGGFVIFQIVEPAATCLVIDASGPGAGGGIDLKLVAVHSVSGEFLLLYRRSPLRCRSCNTGCGIAR
jgi:hypothetical protein